MTDQQRFAASFLDQQWTSLVGQTRAVMLYKQCLEKNLGLLDRIDQQLDEHNDIDRRLQGLIESYFQVLSRDGEPPAVNQRVLQSIVDDVSNCTIVRDQEQSKQILAQSAQTPDNTLHRLALVLQESGPQDGEDGTRARDTTLDKLEIEHLVAEGAVCDEEDAVFVDCCYTAGLLTKQKILQQDIECARQQLASLGADSNGSEAQHLESLYTKILGLQVEAMRSKVYEKYSATMDKLYAKAMERKPDLDELQARKESFERQTEALQKKVGGLQDDIRLFIKMVRDATTAESDDHPISSAAITDLAGQQARIDGLMRLEEELQAVLQMCRDDSPAKNPALSILSENSQMVEELYKQYRLLLSQELQLINASNMAAIQYMQGIKTRLHEIAVGNQPLMRVRNINTGKFMEQFNEQMAAISADVSALITECASQNTQIQHLTGQKMVETGCELNSARQSIQELIGVKTGILQKQCANDRVFDQYSNYFENQKVMDQCIRLLDMQRCQTCGHGRVSYVRKNDGRMECAKCAAKADNITEQYIRCQEL